MATDHHDQASVERAHAAYCVELRTALTRARRRAVDEHPGAVHDLEFGMPLHGRPNGVEDDIDRLEAALLEAGCEIEAPSRWERWRSPR